MIFPPAHRPLFILGLAILLVALTLWSVATGAASIPLREVLDFFWGKSIPHETVLWQLRLPRVLMALLIGGTLSVSGVLIQGLFRNPLADPGLVGVSSGAALGAVTVIILAGTFSYKFAWLHDARLLPWAAFLGGFLVCILIQRLSSIGGQTSVATLLLAGVAINALVGAVIGLATYLATDTQLRTLTFWTLGSLGGASWSTFFILLPFSSSVLLLAPFAARLLNALALGEGEAGHLGFRVEMGKRLLILLVVVGVGVCVALTGIIGFLGLVVPHVLRLLIGPDHRWLIPGSILFGAALLAVADTVSRIIVAPSELPIGIVTAAFGAPVFLALLWQQRRKLRFL